VCSDFVPCMLSPFRPTRFLPAALTSHHAERRSPRTQFVYWFVVLFLRTAIRLTPNPQKPKTQTQQNAANATCIAHVRAAARTAAARARASKVDAACRASPQARAQNKSNFITINLSTQHFGCFSRFEFKSLLLRLCFNKRMGFDKVY